jgi:hypothetical protein
MCRLLLKALWRIAVSSQSQTIVVISMEYTLCRTLSIVVAYLMMRRVVDNLLARLDETMEKRT